MVLGLDGLWRLAVKASGKSKLLELALCVPVKV